MKYEEYEKMITAIIANPDTLATSAVDLLKAIKEDTTTAESTHTANELAQAKIRELQDANYKLFLRVTGQPETKTEPEDDQPFITAMKEIFTTEDK